jgi:uncharacterized protein YoaH (UPF0181 family)
LFQLANSSFLAASSCPQRIVERILATMAARITSGNAGQATISAARSKEEAHEANSVYGPKPKMTLRN